MGDYNGNLHLSAKGSAYENAGDLLMFQTDAEQILWLERRGRNLKVLNLEGKSDGC
jgi:hypothetical protein